MAALDEQMLVRVPACHGRRLHRLPALLPGRAAPTGQCQRARDLPPRLDQVQIDGIGRLEDELPAGMMDLEQQQIVTMVHIQVVEDGIDALLVRRDVVIDPAQEINEVRFGAPRIAPGPAVTRRFSQRPKHMALSTASIINLLLGPPRWARLDVNGLLAGITLGGFRPHLVQAHDNASFG